MKIVSPAKLAEYESVMAGIKPPDDFAGNGVATTGTHLLAKIGLWELAVFAPTAWAILNQVVARWHDWAWTVATTDKEQRVANDWLRTNARTVIEGECGPLWKRLFEKRVLWKIHEATDLASVVI